MRFSIRDLLLFMTGLVAPVAILAWANPRDEGVLPWLATTVGLVYGFLLFISGYAGLILAILAVRRAQSIGQVAACLPLAALSTLIGAFGVVQGYVVSNWILAQSTTYPRPQAIWAAHSVALFHLLVGLAVSFPSYMVLAVGMYRQAWRQQHEA